jgi:hypothetical protein
LSEKKLDFEFKVVTEKESRTFSKVSKYDTMLDSFVASHEKLVEVAMKDMKDANYIRLQVDKRIKKRGLQIKASVSNTKMYLEIVKKK